MELYSRVRIKSTDKVGTIIEEGAPDGNLLYMVQLDDIADYENIDDGLPSCTEDELELI